MPYHANVNSDDAPATTVAAVPPLFAGLVDDAALFPPGNAPMDVAVRDHIRHRHAWYAGLVGPFVCSDAHLERLIAEVDRLPAGTEPLDVSLVLPKGVESMATALPAVAGHARLTLAAVEVAPPSVPNAGDATQAALAALRAAGLPGDCRTYIEVPADGMDDAFGQLEGSGTRAKLRTGGATAAAFPSEQVVAAFIRRCLDSAVPFKCTAGLHHAVRHTATDTGFEHHGFLNVIVAVERGLAGAGIDDLVGVLGERNEETLVAMATRSTKTAGSRRWFDSFGSCSVPEPLEDLITCGLVAAGQADSHERGS